MPSDRPAITKIRIRRSPAIGTSSADLPGQRTGSFGRGTCTRAVATSCLRTATSKKPLAEASVSPAADCGLPVHHPEAAGVAVELAEGAAAVAVAVQPEVAAEVRPRVALHQAVHLPEDHRPRDRLLAA